MYGHSDSQRTPPPPPLTADMRHLCLNVVVCITDKHLHSGLSRPNDIVPDVLWFI